MTGPDSIIPVFSLAVIPAKAGIQSKQSTISNNVYLKWNKLMERSYHLEAILARGFGISASVFSFAG